MEKNQWDFTSEERTDLFAYVMQLINDYYTQLPESAVAPPLDLATIQKHVSKFDFSNPVNLKYAVDHVAYGLSNYQVHTTHPMYFGLFNPRPVFPGILADLLTASFNPQLAAWSHSPFAVLAEQYVITETGKRFGYKETDVDGNFTSGGAEANLTAVLTALIAHFPEYSKEGLRSLPKQPVFYVSKESHHSFVKAARVCGLGTNAVREVEALPNLQMNTEVLERKIAEDIRAGYAPFMVVATAGTTGAGIMDPVQEIAGIAQKHQLWFHIDGAWGGAAVFSDEVKLLIQGCEQADSITFDAHKWFSVPMGAGLYLTRHKQILHETFRIATDYMPKEGLELQVTDPFTHSIQWSRRFIGLKLYLSLLVYGWQGYSNMIDETIRICKQLKELLVANQWKVVNDTILPVICFTDPEREDDDVFIQKVCNLLIQSGGTWLSTYRVNGKLTIRACVINYTTSEDDIKRLVKLLGEARGKA
ncbi:aminotransferase class V-fold PLP-dependent enzyme [Danxiaibacter flavus]|uniref:Aminotransferase class V-fold PLP-dependent enzyme n=1 Tax=Danxiaibacter flavus TaxID=3049108 RepID=A0ABV3ZMN2_9BACT|nr:aminotransferase class V-fold PLP-dependent enzyme [Chitinophagaceae bacterium DXS]